MAVDKNIHSKKITHMETPSLLTSMFNSMQSGNKSIVNIKSEYFGIKHVSLYKLPGDIER